MFVRLTAIAISLWLGTTPVFAQLAQAPGPVPVSPATAATPQPQLDNARTYRNSDGQVIHSPAHTADGSVPAGASAKCRDNTFSFSQHRSGTCSHHGGVATWL